MRFMNIAAIALMVTASCNKKEAPPAPDVDNTGINVRDRAADTQTAGDQKQHKQDVNIKVDVRSKIQGPDMSSNAKNVKSITQDGDVTLRGPVKSQDEKDTIERIAREVAGADRIRN